LHYTLDYPDTDHAHPPEDTVLTPSASGEIETSPDQQRVAS